MTAKVNSNSSKRDEEYKSSAQQIVDRAMEAQILAPAIVVAMQENKPLNDELHKMFGDAVESDKEFDRKLRASVVEMIRNNKEIQGAIDEVVSNNDAIKRSQSPLRTKAYWIPIISSAVIGIGGIVAAVVTAIVAANR